METTTTTEEMKVETPAASAPVTEPAEAPAAPAETTPAPTPMTAVKATSAQAKGVCDIVFLIDATGSMAPAISDLKSNIKNFFKSLSAADANGKAVVKDWRARVIGYRDVTADGEAWYVDNPFVRDASQIEAQLSALYARFGPVPEKGQRILLSELILAASQHPEVGPEDLISCIRGGVGSRTL